MKKAAGVITTVLVLGALSAVPAQAGQADVASGSVYKGFYEYGTGMSSNFRIKTFQSGTGGNFSLKCAGIVRERIEIDNGKFKFEFGADAVLVKGNGKFLKNGFVEGSVRKIMTVGASCTSPGVFDGGIADF